MSISTELQNYETYLSNAWQKVEDKGGTIPQNKNLQNLTSAINTIEGKTIIPPEAGTLTGISFQSLPTKLTYNEGESMDFTGCVILGSYSSGNTYNVTNNCTFTINNPLLWTDTQVVVTLDTFTLYIPIVVNGIPVEAPSTLYSLYHFENNLYDEVSGTIGEGTYTERVGRFGNAEYISSANIPISPKLRVPITTATYQQTNPLTIEWWARLESNTNTNIIMTLNYLYLDSSQALNRICVGDFRTSTSQSSTFYLYTGTDGWGNSPTTLNQIPSTTDWTLYHHIAIVFNGGSVARVFVDGTPITQSTVKASNTNKVPNGYFQFSSTFRIDEFMVCNEMKYWDSFTPNHAPYYIAENNNE